MNNIETGKIGENTANKYLINKKYLILARNHKERFDEIDIIARDFSGILVFCEVKTLEQKTNFNSQFMPEDNLSPMKLKKMVRAAQIFIARHPWLVEERGWRIDLIAIVLRNGQLADLRHYENI